MMSKRISRQKYGAINVILLLNVILVKESQRPENINTAISDCSHLHNSMLASKFFDEINIYI